MKQNGAYFRFYEELNDFLPREKFKKEFEYRFNGNPSIKDAIEANGVPHTEVDLILVNSEAAGFSYILRDGDRISVYPVFESLDISSVSHLRPAPLREIKFILDVHLGKLCKYLRMFGFDTYYRRDYDDPEIIGIAAREGRIILTRDVEMLKSNKVTHGYWIRSQVLEEQLEEVFRRFDLTGRVKPFDRCLACNGPLMNIQKDEVLQELLPLTRRYYQEFARCGFCGMVYWKGSHYLRMQKFIESFTLRLENTQI